MSAQESVETLSAVQSYVISDKALDLKHFPVNILITSNNSEDSVI